MENALVGVSLKTTWHGQNTLQRHIGSKEVINDPHGGMPVEISAAARAILWEDGIRP
jgi:hypothetical protein